MITRASDLDDWKLEHWDEYIASCNFEIPEDLHDPNVKDDLLIFNNNNDEEFEKSMKEITGILNETINQD